MNVKSYDVPALLGSRICHDLISPLGAIGNGVELLAMGGMGNGAEVSLISDSVEHANARIRYFRIAFGAGSDITRIGQAELMGVLEAFDTAGRLKVEWEVSGDVSRNEAKIAFLLLMCLEPAMPYGGTVRFYKDQSGWSVKASGDKVKVDEDLWVLVCDPNGEVHPEIAPAQVQYILAAQYFEGVRARPEITFGDGQINITY
ncbi:MAG: histidine phosphotransferase family protein [Pseudomonadota bacterium]